MSRMKSCCLLPLSRQVVAMRTFGRAVAQMPSSSAIAMSPALEASPEKTSSTGGHDAPVTQRDQDDLERWPIARAIHRVIATTPAGWATRIGLYGRWGTGKTSVLNFLEEQEKQARNLVVRFSAWSAVGEAGVIALLYESLDAKLSESGVAVPPSSWLKKTILRFGQAAQQTGTGAAASGAVDALLPGAGVAASAAGNFVLSKLSVDKKDLDSLLTITRAAGYKRIVVFIDDLDRADPKVLPKTLLALREMLDWPDFAFVVAFDKEVVAKSLGDYSAAFGESADRFLEKIIDVPFVLPVPTSPQVRRLAKRALDSCCEFMPAESRARLAEWFPWNPRTAKLVARSLGALRDAAVRHDPAEIDWYAVGVQTTLRTVAPAISEEVECSMLGIGADLRGDLGVVGKDAPDPHEVVKALVERLASKDADHAEKRWLVGLVEAVKRARIGQPEARIAYEMGLLVDEPPFTWREYRALLNGWIAAPSDVTVQRELAEACSRSGKNAAEAADDLVQSAINGYGESLDGLSEVHDMPEYTFRFGQCEQRLSFLEWLCKVCGEPEVAKAVRSKRHCAAMYGLFGRWRHYNFNAGDRGLRDRELALLLAAGAQCADPLPLYRAMDPMRHDTLLAPHGVDPRVHAAWAESVRRPLEGRVIDAAVAWFHEAGGVSRTAITEDDDGLGAWLIESPGSPLYRDAASSGRLLAVFEEAARLPLRETSSRVRDNALMYCYRLLEGRRNGAWLSPEQRPAFVAKHGDLMAAAWSAIVAVEPQQRALFRVKDLHSKLVASGLTPAQLTRPGWLTPDEPALPAEPAA